MGNNNDVMQLNRASQASLLMTSLDEDTTSGVLRHLTAEDIEALGHLAEQEYTRDARTLARACREYLIAAKSTTFPADAEISLIGRLVQHSPGRDRWRTLFGEADAETPGPVIENRKPEEVVAVLASESPRVIAAILAELSPKYVASLFNLMEPGILSNVLSEMATLELLTRLMHFFEENSESAAGILRTWIHDHPAEAGEKS
jgi:flagellar motor switch protein FliG